MIELSGRVIYLLRWRWLACNCAQRMCVVEINSRSGSRLSSLALQSANSLLSPLGSHLGLDD
jgi:hypothetical protein